MNESKKNTDFLKKISNFDFRTKDGLKALENWPYSSTKNDLEDFEYLEKFYDRQLFHRTHPIWENWIII